MYRKVKLICLSFFILFSTMLICQTSKIIKLDEKNAYQHTSYYEDGSVKSIVGFYAKKPYEFVEAFEAKLKKYQVKYHGESKEFYQNGQLYEIVVYEKRTNYLS